MFLIYIYNWLSQWIMGCLLMQSGILIGTQWQRTMFNTLFHQYTMFAELLLNLTMQESCGRLTQEGQITNTNTKKNGTDARKSNIEFKREYNSHCYSICWNCRPPLCHQLLTVYIHIVMLWKRRKKIPHHCLLLKLYYWHPNLLK